MQNLLDFYPGFQMLLKASITASILVGLILLVRMVLGKRLSPRWQYFLWIIVVLRLILPYFPQSNFSIFNLFVSPERNIVLNNSWYSEESIQELPKPDRAIVTAYIAANSVSAAVTSPGEYLNVLSYKYNNINATLFYNLWVNGALVFAVLLMVLNIAFWLKIRKTPSVNADEINGLIRECSKIMNIKKDIPAVITKHVTSPAIYGLIKPKILLPDNILDVVGEKRLRYIILHELAHYKRKDIGVNFLLSILQVLHWFNPIMWYAFHKMKQDRELACDALALEYLEPEEKKQYGETIIDLLRNYIRPVRLSGVIGISSSKSQMKRRINMISLFKGKSRKWTILAIVLIVILGSAALTNAVGTRRVDNINYPFVDDPQVIGKWQTVDFVQNIERFDPDKIKWKKELFLNDLVFIKGGSMLWAMDGGRLAPIGVKWTNGLINDPQDKTASKYITKEINGTTYMFFEWKSGDYTIRGMEPWYYVLKKVDSNDYSDFKPERTVDNIDLPFVDDPAIIGKWESVDFVRTIEEFKPNNRSWDGDLFLNGMEFEAEGVVKDARWMKWTKGVITHSGDQTASKYEIKEMSGSTYMFFEWKSGDYTLRGMKPQYYVLKKVQ